MSIQLLEYQKDFTFASQFVFMSFLPTLSLQDNTIFVKSAKKSFNQNGNGFNQKGHIQDIFRTTSSLLLQNFKTYSRVL